MLASFERVFDIGRWRIVGRRARYGSWIDAPPFPGVELRKVPGELAWTLHDDAGVQLGRVERRHLGRSGTFWAAYGIHPELNREVSLELSADRDERIARVLDFRNRPDAYRQHWQFAAPLQGRMDS